MAIRPVWKWSEHGIAVYRAPRAESAHALSQLLARRMDLAEERVRLEWTAAGKPFIRNGPAFSIAHAGGASLIAIGDDLPIGVDVERLEPFGELPAVAEMLLSGDERATVLRLRGDARVGAFYRAWVRLEAKIKAAGEALTAHGPLDGIATQTFMVQPDTIAAVAIALGPNGLTHAGLSAAWSGQRGLRAH